VEPTAVVTAAARRTTALNLSAVRARQNGSASNSLTRYLPSETPTGVEIVASVDVPGFRPGQEFDIPQVVEGAMRRATGLKTAGGGTGMVASYRLPFPDELIVKDAASAQEGSLAIMRAAEQHRLPQGDLVASGGRDGAVRLWRPKGGDQVAARGPGNDWRCVVSWHLPDVEATGSAIYQLDVTPDGRYVADGDGPQEVNGFFQVHTSSGDVPNPLWQFDGSVDLLTR